MKILKNSIYALLVPVVLLGLLVTSSCNEDEGSGGTPAIHYVRVSDADAADSLLIGAFLGDMVVIVGENLGETREVWFNDQVAQINPAFITDNNVFAIVPSRAPSEITNTLRLVTRDGSVATHDFVIIISPPSLESMVSEYAPVGSSTTIEGNFFFEPITVTFTGTDGPVEAIVENVEQEAVTFTVPEGAEPGPVTVTTNFGTTVSGFHYKDQRNIFLNYDDLNSDGSWRPGLYINDEHSLDGNYMRYRGVYSTGQRIEGPENNGQDIYETQFWAQVNGRPAGNLLPGEPEDYVLKFETKVIEWYGSYLNICFSTYDHNNSNQEIWSNDINARAIWGPWAETGETYSTDGVWVTVTIPITDFKWAMGTNDDGDVVYTETAFNKENTGSMSFWVLSAPEADNSPFEFYIDNVRIVPKN